MKLRLIIIIIINEIRKKRERKKRSQFSKAHKFVIKIRMYDNTYKMYDNTYKQSMLYF